MTTKIDFSDAKKDIANFKKKGKSALKDVYKKEIVESIERGVSPVKGQGRFQQYSESYKDAISAGRYSRFAKRKRPVNLKLSGDLLKSIFVKVTNKGLLIGFDNKLADIHNNRGAGKSKAVRRMLPTKEGEEFSRSITIRAREVLNRIAANIFKR